MISDSSNPSVKNAYPSFSYSIDTSSRTAVRSRRLFYALQQKSSLTHFVAPPSKNKTARPLQASSTTSALRCAGFCFVVGALRFSPLPTSRGQSPTTPPLPFSSAPQARDNSRPARRLRFSPSPPRRRGLQFVRDDFFMPRSSRAFFSRIMLQMPPRCFLPQRHFSLLGLLYAPSCPGNRSICIRVLRTGHSFIY